MSTANEQPQALGRPPAQWEHREGDLETALREVRAIATSAIKLVLELVPLVDEQDVDPGNGSRSQAHVIRLLHQLQCITDTVDDGIDGEDESPTVEPES